MLGKFNFRWPFPPDLKLKEFDGDIPDILQRIRKRFGLLEEYLWNLFAGLTTATDDCFSGVRWIHTTVASTAGQTVFTLPPDKLVEDTPLMLVFARDSFQYHTTHYTVSEAANTVTFLPGLNVGQPLTIYALKNDNIQEVAYEVVAVPAAPYAFSPPVTLDRAAGRQLLFARSSFRFLDSGRAGDEYTVSNTANTVSYTAGLGPVDERGAVVRLKETAVKWHEELIATVAGQTQFSPDAIGMTLPPDLSGRLIVSVATSFRHPTIDFVTDPTQNTLTLTGPGLAIGQPLNIWVLR